MPDIVVGVHDLKLTLGERPGVLHRDQNAVEYPAGGQSPAAEVIALATSSQKYEYRTG
jgi:hypothetical protein